MKTAVGTKAGAVTGTEAGAGAGQGTRLTAKAGTGTVIAGFAVDTAAGFAMDGNKLKIPPVVTLPLFPVALACTLLAGGGGFIELTSWTAYSASFSIYFIRNKV